MSSENETKPLRERILEDIKCGKAKMRPKWHFMLYGTLFLIGISIVAIVLLYGVSFIIFILHENGVWFMPSFGLRGVGKFLLSLPWLLILATIGFLIVLEILVRRYSFAYRRPLLYSLLALSVLVGTGSVIVSETGLHKRFVRFSEKEKVPLVHNFYKRYGVLQMEGIHAGFITSIGSGTIQIVTFGSDTVVIKTGPFTRLPFGTNFTVGDRILVAGDIVSSSIEAFGIRKIEEGFLSRKPNRPEFQMRIMVPPPQ